MEISGDQRTNELGLANPIEASGTSNWYFFFLLLLSLSLETILPYQPGASCAKGQLCVMGIWLDTQKHMFAVLVGLLCFGLLQALSCPFKKKKRLLTIATQANHSQLCPGSWKAISTKKKWLPIWLFLPALHIHGLLEGGTQCHWTPSFQSRT